MIKIAINGFGRVGSSAFKVAFDNDDVEVVAINDPGDLEALANSMKYDSVYGPYDKEVEVGKGEIVVDGQKIPVFSELEPEKLPWKKLGVDVVIESTGVFRDKEGAAKHITAGAKKVVISAPAKGDDVPTHVISVNSEDLSGSGDVINNASCTTNCISPVIALMHSKFGIEKAMMSTIHGYTADQRLVDGVHKKDPRRGRAAALNIIPTSTGAAKATTETIPELKDKFDGMAFRVPVPVGSISDITMLLSKDVTVDDVNAVFTEAAAEHPLFKGIVEVTNDPVVSTDIIGSTASATVDLALTQVVGGNLVKVVAWYDNEWGYSNRLVEQAVNLGNTIS